MTRPTGVAQAWLADFHRPALFAGLRQLSQGFGHHRDWPRLAELDRLAEAADLRNAQGLPVRFRTQSDRIGQKGYEDGIWRTGEVPSREANWHDFFNALMWLAWPRTKARLNQLQHTAHAAGPRGPLADAVTLFDESGLVLVAKDPALAEALWAKQWQTAFWERRGEWADARLYVIGHSLLEKSLAPTPGMTGKCLFVQADEIPEAEAAIPTWLDARVAALWEGGGVTRPAELFPLPLAGVPGWAAGNDRPEFYADTEIFRPARTVEP